MNPELLLHLELNKFEKVGTREIVKDASAGQREGEVLGRVDIVEDDAFGACALFDGVPGNCIRVSAHNDLNINGDFTLQAWVYASNESPTSARVVGLGEELSRSYGLWAKDGQWDFQCPGVVTPSLTVSPPGTTLNSWYHLSGVVEGGKASIQIHDLQGRLSGYKEIHKETTPDVVPDDSLTIGFLPDVKSTSDSGRVAHVRLYRGARTQTQIKQDMAADRLALAPFRKNHPIDFQLHDEDGQPVLYISEAPDGQRLNVELRNTSPQDVRLGGSDPAQPASESNHHFALHFNPGVLSRSTLALLSNPSERARVLSSNEPWELGFPAREPAADERVALYLLYKGDETVFGPNERRTITLQRMSAAPGSGARGTQVQLHPRGLTAAGDAETPVTGMRTQYVHITNRRGQKNIPLHVWFAEGNTVLNDGKAQKLALRIGNGSDSVDIALTEKSLVAPSKFLFSFDVGDAADSWALTSKGGAEKVGFTIKQGHGELTESTRGQGARRQWELTFASAAVLSRRGTPGHNHLDLAIEGLEVPAGWCGHANLYVSYENIPGYQDGQFILTIEKSPLALSSGTVGIGRPATPGYALSVQGGVHIGGNAQPGTKNLRVDGDIGVGSLKLASGPLVRGITAASTPASGGDELIPTVSFVREFVGSMQDALFYSVVKIPQQLDATVQYDFDAGGTPGVTLIGKVVTYHGMVKLTTRRPAWRVSQGWKWDDVADEMARVYGEFVGTPRLQLSIENGEARGSLLLRNSPGGHEGIGAEWRLYGNGGLCIQLDASTHQTIYQYEGHYDDTPNEWRGVFHDKFRERTFWIDLSQITYSL